MINATGHLFLSKTAPLAARTADALAFWTTHRSALQPGCALHGTYSKLRVYYNARVPGIDAQVISLELAPRAQNTQQTNHPSTQPEATAQ